MEIDFYDLFYAAREAQILWKKRRQHAQGKINLQAGDDGWDWSVDECNEMIEKYAKTERWLWKQLPDIVQLDGSAGEYVVDSLRMRFEPFAQT
jgi:hypothetical protein